MCIRDRLNRERECIDDFLAHKDQIAKCFKFCLDAYIHNHGSLKAAATNQTSFGRPFTAPRSGSLKSEIRLGRYIGKFRKTAKKFGIDKLLERWVLSEAETEELTIKKFAAYLTLVTSVCFPYLASFTFQRKEELAALRSDCLIWEQDPTVGPIPIIRGETTKTDPDSDARWPTSPHVAVAIEAATAISSMRMTCVYDRDSEAAKAYLNNPLLFCPPTEPWSASKTIGTISLIRGYSAGTYAGLLASPNLFDSEILKITEEDRTHAKMFTPNLSKSGAFAIGKVWPLAFHQLRRTGGINMYASGVLSESSIQLILKHLAIFQTRYYGKHFSSSRINQKRQNLVITAAYEVLAKNIIASVEARYISPAGNLTQHDKDVHLISAGDFKKLVAAAKNGEIPFRQTTLGGCIKRSACEYNGIESVARCAGGDGKEPCHDAKLDTAKRGFVLSLLAMTEKQLQEAKPNSRRQAALQMEVNAMRNYCELTAN